MRDGHYRYNNAVIDVIAGRAFVLCKRDTGGVQHVALAHIGEITVGGGQLSIWANRSWYRIEGCELQDLKHAVSLANPQSGVSRETAP